MGGSNHSLMQSEIASYFVRKSVGALGDHRYRCSRCRRIPLPGELVHELASHRQVCQLCLARLPEEKRETVESRRVHISERRVSVAPRAA